MKFLDACKSFHECISYISVSSKILDHKHANQLLRQRK
uniref:Uncharacterized protein MANES_12G099700 n=1 Tax=Rhizophora mucronata TaxID=61149 RepID=A0A2P2JVL5_RHIMU